MGSLSVEAASPSTDAVAYAAGFVTFRSREVALTSDERARLRAAFERFDKCAHQCVTVYVRWVLLNVDELEIADLWRETLAQWRARRPTYGELLHYLRGFFDWCDAPEAVTCAHARVLATEIDRVYDGLPVRYQQLFFELLRVCKEHDERKNDDEGKDGDGDTAEPSTVDLSGLKTALEANRPTGFSALSASDPDAVVV